MKTQKVSVPSSPMGTHQFTEFTPLQYLQIDIAGAYGMDKDLWEERIAWTLKHEGQFEKVVENAGSHLLVQSAEDPALFYAGVSSYLKAKDGLAIGHLISLDATASGLQILSCLTGCYESAQFCNLVNNGERVDAYKALYSVMEILNGGQLEIEDEQQQLRLVKADGTLAPAKKKRIKRKDFKQAIMTSLYCSTRVPKNVFGTGAMLDTFYLVMRTCLPGAWACNDALKNLWQPYALNHDWVLPDNFHVHVKVMTPIQHMIQVDGVPMGVTITENVGTEEGRSLPANATHSVDGMVVREMSRRCDFDPKQIRYVLDALKSMEARCTTQKDKKLKVLWDHYLDSGFLSARILDYITPKNAGMISDPVAIMELIKTMPKTPFKVVSVHDCFRCHPNYGNDLRRQYNHILSDIARSNMLEYLAVQVTGKPYSVTKATCIADAILEADYALS